MVSLQEASVRALKMSGGRFEAALDFLPKQNEPVNGMSKGPSSGKFTNVHLRDLVCYFSIYILFNLKLLKNTYHFFFFIDI